MLDLSRPPIDLNREHLRSLLHPPATRVPSLRVLGLRDLKTEGDKMDLADDAGDGEHPGLTRLASTQETKRSMLEVIRGGGRSRYIEVKWD
jgi:hypothetical protein